MGLRLFSTYKKAKGGQGLHETEATERREAGERPKTVREETETEVVYHGDAVLYGGGAMLADVVGGTWMDVAAPVVIADGAQYAL